MLRFVFAAGLIATMVALAGPGGAQAAEHFTPAPLLTPASQTVDRCHKQCAPLLKLDSRSEASRTYRNCRALCDRKGTVTCPNGKVQSWKNPRC